ncbi:flagellar basal body-associated protein FliL [Pseudomonas sp. C27(2019)]|uniref:flagellar basal body-associated FliL family protein n=1 Tax=Pseudomonas sp. C27(2019) TaxID=2604941 RepID=UPI001246B66F|nr:flagellar basal body-associated FliL family protein [Pseudomonas sp. C27(2019)]QEY59046.1 flagellar basal body-associated protein FliL [Pseudomonas sp. C27(2019)]
MANDSETSEQAAQIPKKNKMKIIILAVLALVVAVALSAVGTWFFLGRAPAEAQPVVESSVKQQAIYEVLTPAFVVNFKSEGKARYLQVSVALMGRNQADLNELKVHMPTLRNQLVMLFSSQSFEELNSVLGIELLKQKATAAVQELALIEVGKPVIEQVLFTNVVMQ